MSIAKGIGARELAKFKESTATANQVGVVVLNPDGSSIGSGGGSIDTIAGDPVVTTATGLLAVGLVDTTNVSIEKAEDAAHVSGDKGFMSLAVRKDTAVALAGTDADYTPLITNGTGHLHSAEGFAPVAEDNTLGVLYSMERPVASLTNAVTLDTSSAAEASSVTKASAGKLYGFVFSNANAAVRYLQFFNSTTVPADTTVPFLCFQVAASTTTSFFFPMGIPFSTGIAWCNSSTQNTKTIGSADSIANVFYA
jgi:hypothetical protein